MRAGQAVAVAARRRAGTSSAASGMARARLRPGTEAAATGRDAPAVVRGGRAVLGRDAGPVLAPTAACGCGLAQRLRRPGEVRRQRHVGAGRCSACLRSRDTEVTWRPSGRSGGRSRPRTRSRTSASSRSCAASGAPACTTPSRASPAVGSRSSPASAPLRPC